MNERSSTVPAARTTGDVRADDGGVPVAEATGYVADSRAGSIVFDLSEGALADASHLAFDFLLDDADSAVARVRLHEGGNADPTFVHVYAMLPQCEGRVRLPVAALDQETWQLDREGAWCKPMVYGDPVDPDAVERIEVSVGRPGGEPVRWCQTPLRLAEEEPPRVPDPALPEGALLDEFGQSAVREWDGRTENEAELVERLRGQRARARDEGREGARPSESGAPDRSVHPV